MILFIDLFKSISIAVVLCLSHLSGLTQSSGFLSYSVADGLAQSNVVGIGEDPMGNLWLATFGGLSKFNGVSFENFSIQDGLISNRLTCLTVDPEGQIWVGSNLGISSFNGRKFSNYSVPAPSGSQGVIQIYADRQGHIWFGTSEGGLFQLLPQGRIIEFKQASGDTMGIVTGMVEDSGSLWITTANGTVYRKKTNGEEFESVELPEKLKQAEISAIFCDINQNIWLGTSEGLFFSSGTGFEWMHSFHDESPEFGIYTINEEKPGTIWLGTTHGAYKYQKGICTSIKASEGLTDNIVYDIHRDREGTLWFGSFGGGVFKSLGQLFTHIGKSHGMQYDYVSSITKGKNNYWFGSYGGGVYRYLPETAGKPYQISNLSSAQGLCNNFVFATEEDALGNLWVATAWGLGYYDGKSFTNYFIQDGLPSNQALSLLRSSDGRLYCGTANGLCVINPGSTDRFLSFHYQGAGPHNRVRAMLELNDGSILLGTHGGLKIFRDGKITNYFSEDSLNSKPVSAIHLDQEGGVWCSLVDEGILYSHAPSGKKILYTEKSGLSNNIIYSLARDKTGAIWAGTPSGLDKITFDHNGQIKDVKNFAANEGFFGIETNTNALLVEPNGSIWFGTVAGAYLCDPQIDVPNTLEPITFLTDIRLFSQKVDWSQLADSTLKWFNIPHNLKLAHNQNHITFQFLGNSLKNPQKVQYQYMLENFDRNWQPVTHRNEAVYTNVPPGQYVFNVKASNNDGVWNSLPITFSFEITPPFWRTWWFFTLTVLIVGLLGRLYYNFRVQRKLKALMQVENIKHQETVKVRKRVAEDFHDQVGNQLASITVLVQLIQAKLATRDKDVEELLQKLGQFTKTLFTGTRDFIWSIDPKSDNVNEMLIYIRDFGEELFEYSGINFHVDTNDTFDTKMTLPVGWSRHVVYIFKEALTNSLKHANCQNVYLKFNVCDHNFVFELTDDGQGLNGYQEPEDLGMGLRNMKERAKKISSHITITSQNGEGTKITLEGKIPQNAG